MWKRLQPVWKYYPSICLQGLRQTTRNFVTYSCSEYREIKCLSHLSNVHHTLLSCIDVIPLQVPKWGRKQATVLHHIWLGTYTRFNIMPSQASWGNWWWWSQCQCLTSAIKMEAVYSSEMSLCSHMTTWQNSPQHHHLCCHHHVNIESWIFKLYLWRRNLTVSQEIYSLDLYLNIYSFNKHCLFFYMSLYL
jgi:hypothetical protein